MEVHTLFVNTNGREEKRMFLLYKSYENNKELSQRFGTERELRISCAVEIDEEKRLKEWNGPSLYCILPLVGSEELQLPFLINSPDFQPDSEREALYLNGIDRDEKTNKISDTGINRMILQQVINIYRNFCNHLVNHQYQNIWLLGRGFKYVPNFGKFFDRFWYETKFIDPMRDIMVQMPIVETLTGVQPLCKNGVVQQIFPCFKFVHLEKGGNEKIEINQYNEYYEQYYQVCALLYPNNIPKRDCVEK